MKQPSMIKLPARKQVPATSIYTEIYTKSGHLGERDVLMLMPGGPGNDHTVCDYGDNSFADSLLPYADVILFDPRGCGNSEKSPIEYCTLEHYIDDVEAIREHFNLSANKITVMEVSYGAIAALSYAIKYTTNFKKLILVCGSTSGAFIEQAKQNLLKLGTPAQQKMGETILNGDFALTPETISGYYETMGPLYSTTFQPGLPTPSISYNLELANLGFKTFLKNFDYRSKLSEVKSQTLIIAGEQDWIADKKQAELMHKGITNSKLVIYQNCGHMIWIDQWDHFLQDVIHFLK